MTSVRIFASQLLASLVLVCVIQSAQVATAGSDPPRRQAKEKAGAAGPEEPTITRVYVVEELLFEPGDYPYRGSLPTTGPFDQGGRRASAFGARGGSGGGMGGGGMGGGGMFSVSDPTILPNVLRQFGGPAGAAGQMPPSRQNGRAAQLVNLIKAVVKGDWEGGNESPDQCMIFGGSLIVRSTKESHEQIAELLKSLQSGNTARSVTIEATWIVLDAQKRDALRATPGRTLSDGQSAHGIDSKQLRILMKEAAAYRGQLTCLNGQTVHFATGQRRVVPSGATPTVGVGAVGYSTSLEVLNIGAVLQVTPIVTHSGDGRVILDLHSVVTQWGKPGEPIRVTSQSLAGMSEKSGGGGTLVHTMATIDRVNLGTQEWSTTVRAPLGEPALVGAVTLTEPTDQAANAGEAKRAELALIVEVIAN